MINQPGRLSLIVYSFIDSLIFILSIFKNRFLILIFRLNFMSSTPKFPVCNLSVLSRYKINQKNLDLCAKVHKLNIIVLAVIKLENFSHFFLQPPNKLSNFHIIHIIFPFNSENSFLGDDIINFLLNTW